ADDAKDQLSPARCFRCRRARGHRSCSGGRHLLPPSLLALIFCVLLALLLASAFLASAFYRVRSNAQSLDGMAVPNFVGLSSTTASRLPTSGTVALQPSMS